MAHQAISTSGTIQVFNAMPRPYHVKVIDQFIPLGPVTLNLAVDGFGFWDIAGGIEFGLAYAGASDAIQVLQQGLNGQLLSDGDIRVFGGPAITPAVGVGVLAYAGVGIPGLSIGIQGKIDLLDVSLPTGVVGAAVRTNRPDPRTLPNTDYAGTPIAGLEPTDYQWVTGYDWGMNRTSLAAPRTVSGRPRRRGAG